MIADQVGVLDDLLGFEVAQVDHGHAGARLVVDEQELAVIVAGRLAQGRVVGVAHADLGVADVAAVQDFLGVLGAVAVALPRFGRKDGDALEDAHRGDADDDNGAGLAAGHEEVVFVQLAAGRVGHHSGAHVSRRQAALVGYGDDVGGQGGSCLGGCASFGGRSRLAFGSGRSTDRNLGRRRTFGRAWFFVVTCCQHRAQQEQD